MSGALIGYFNGLEYLKYVQFCISSEKAYVETCQIPLKENSRKKKSWETARLNMMPRDPRPRNEKYLDRLWRIFLWMSLCLISTIAFCVTRRNLKVKMCRHVSKGHGYAGQPTNKISRRFRPPETWLGKFQVWPNQTYLGRIHSARSTKPGVNFVARHRLVDPDRLGGPVWASHRWWWCGQPTAGKAHCFG